MLAAGYLWARTACIAATTSMTPKTKDIFFNTIKKENNYHYTCGDSYNFTIDSQEASAFPELLLGIAGSHRTIL